MRPKSQQQEVVVASSSRGRWEFEPVKKGPRSMDQIVSADSLVRWLGPYICNLGYFCKALKSHQSPNESKQSTS